MSEKPDWKKEMGELMDQKIKPLSEAITAMKPSLPSSTHKGHETVAEILACPDCKAKHYPDMVKAVIEEEFKDADHVCEECGLPVKGEKSAKKEWNCPGCGHYAAKPK